MRFKRILATACALALTLPLLTVSAHPGGVDEFGGHEDTDGSYHYHHGYPAHEHHDLDADGDLDCPYEWSGDATASQKYTDGYNQGYQAGFEEGLTEGRKEVLIWLIPISLSALGVLIYLAIPRRHDRLAQTE